MVPAAFYIGVDGRDKITPKDNLAVVAKSEIKGTSYGRVSISASGGFLPSWEKPLLTEREMREGQESDPVFVLNATATFVAKGENMGQVKNYFLTTVATGTSGLLLVSSSLRKPFDLDRGYKLTVGMSISLRDAIIEE